MRSHSLCLLFIALFLVKSVAAEESEFDHFTTGFVLNGPHELAACASCHVQGQFAGTPRQCVACHSNHGAIQATTQPAFHITTSDQCSACHSSFSWTPTRRVDHREVFGTCSSCHNGLRAPGQSPNHIPTTAECDTCHRTTTFGFARFGGFGNPAP